jgi:hypothetical protein
MKYLMTIYVDDAAVESIDEAERDAAHAALAQELLSTGEWLDGRQLADRGRVVRRTEQGLLVTEGPFTEGREYAGGYYLMECASIERVIELAGTLVESRYSPIEVREIIDRD